MSQVNRVVIVGGGTAGWLTAGILAAKYGASDDRGQRLSISLIESSTVHPIGVGEGTWPTMRNTLSSIGLSESQLIKQASASFKQASKFVNWHKGEASNAYYHPFSAPQGSARLDISPYWLLKDADKGQYAHDVCFQPALCEAGLAPKVSANGNQSFVANYGYHLDAGEFITLLREHCTQELGVEHIVDDVVSVEQDNSGIAALQTKKNGLLQGDFFVDCTGFEGLLIEKALGVGIQDASHQLFADTALVSQLPYDNPNAPIACHTLSTAQEAGWIWDIGLQHRRGTGYVFSSDYQSTDAASETFANYLRSLTNAPVDEGSFRTISFKTGYRKQFWVKNCVAIGLSSGFLEPLEASALMLIEQSAAMLAEQLPTDTSAMHFAQRRFNSSLTYMWERTIEFLKLHYVLSNNQTPFWQDNRSAQSIPEQLACLLEEWRHRPILDSDFPSTHDVFSAQSYRYILYGMSDTQYSSHSLRGYMRTMNQQTFATKQFQLNHSLVDQLKGRLPSHRGLIERFF
ncbi:tryptophan halogenase family protein [Alteromonas sp. 009811495]|uniref:tryptophan halogenase family protein n=1 Tax=Alteromonas sp. 009811495 TaxID=3002962 RepID=UPI00237DE958|nr:tryptophan halogenase family protein [Alteromonas sp. 009811495]WDT86387.1 tryptophan 7-halogenase [Alteromonas sp. 009811495]